MIDDFRGKRFLCNEVVILLDGIGDRWRLRYQADFDPIGVLAANFLAAILDEPHDIARQAFGTSSGVNSVASTTTQPLPCAAAQPSLAARRTSMSSLSSSIDVPSGSFSVRLAGRLEFGQQFAGVDFAEQLFGGRHVLAQPRAEPLEIRHDRVADVLLRRAS